MPIISDIKRERANLVSIVNRSKLARRVTDDILFPILDALENSAFGILEEVGKKIEKELINGILSTVPSDQSYKIYYIDPDAPRGQKIQDVDEYTPSLMGMPPKSLTGSLIECIGYQVNADGSVDFGLIKDTTGEEFESMSYFPGKIYVDITGERNKKKTVKEYASILDSENYAFQRPWFDEILNDYLRDEIRKFIRLEIKKALNKITKRSSVRRAMIFKVYFRRVG